MHARSLAHEPTSRQAIERRASKEERKIRRRTTKRVGKRGRRLLPPPSLLLLLRKLLCAFSDDLDGLLGPDLAAVRRLASRLHRYDCQIRAVEMDADDMIKRNILSSLVALTRRKKQPPSTTARSAVQKPQKIRADPVPEIPVLAHNPTIETCSTSSWIPPPPVPVSAQHICQTSAAQSSSSSEAQIWDHHPELAETSSLAPEREILHVSPEPASIERHITLDQIYREIRDECQAIESSGATTPLSPTSPFTSQNWGPAPPAYSPNPTVSEFLVPQMAALQPYALPQPQDMKVYTEPHQIEAPTVTGATGAGVNLEELVRVVVAVVREQQQQSQQNSGANSPISGIPSSAADEILQRKRKQNNEAAARYRKRQREAKGTAASELEKLLARKQQLEEEEQNLEAEIERLKKAVLNRGPGAATSQADK